MDVRYITSPPPYPSSRLLLHFLFTNRYILTMYMEHVLQNDCYYRAMLEYEYVAVLDIDELPIFPDLNNYVE